MEQNHSSQLSTVSLSLYNGNLQGMCRICHCEEKTDSPLICPCNCSGSMCYVHISCLVEWIKSSGTRSCKVCKFKYIMHRKVKPFWKFEKLKLLSTMQLKIRYFTYLVIAISIFCIIVHQWIVSITSKMRSPKPCVLWIMIMAVTIFLLLNILEVYIQCKDNFKLLLRRCRAFNSTIYVQNAPGKVAMMLQKQAAVLSTYSDTRLNPSVLTSFKTKRLSPNEDKFHGCQSSINNNDETCTTGKIGNAETCFTKNILTSLTYISLVFIDDLNCSVSKVGVHCAANDAAQINKILGHFATNSTGKHPVKIGI